jgi:hypothetical protein
VEETGTNKQSEEEEKHQDAVSARLIAFNQFDIRV